MKSLRDIVLPVVTDIGPGRQIEVSELWGASKALFLFGLQHESGRPLVVVTASEDAGEALVEDLRFFLTKTPRSDGQNPEIRLFPSWGVLPFEADSPDSRTVGERMRFLYSLVSDAPAVFVVPVPSLVQKLPPWDLFVDSIKTISLKSPLDPDRLVASLIATGYESTSLVTRVGEFSRRGGIIDFFSPFQEQPVRLEFFGDTLESLRHFDPESQRSTEEIAEAVVLPVRELFVNEAGVERFAQAVSDEALVDRVREGVLPPGVEFLAPFFYPLESLFRYLPEHSVVALIEPDDVKREIEAQLSKSEAGRHEETE
jgi:transcription-repair coupling factor (superfamily II helicase)